MSAVRDDDVPLSEALQQHQAAQPDGGAPANRKSRGAKSAAKLASKSGDGPPPRETGTPKHRASEKSASSTASSKRRQAGGAFSGPLSSTPLVQALTRYARCSQCAMDTPFCCATGRSHAVVPPCALCGLSTLYCPLTGKVHGDAVDAEGGGGTPTQPLDGAPPATPPRQAARRRVPKVSRDAADGVGATAADGPGDSPPTTKKRIESSGDADKAPTRLCVRCGKRLVAKSAVLPCPACTREYHAACYRADTGLAVDPHAPPPCSVCVSGVLPPLGDSVGERSHEAQLLTQGFVVVPLYRTQAEREALVAVLRGLGEDMASLFAALMKAHECRDTTRTLADGYANFRERGKGRYEVLADHIAPTLMPLWEASPCASVVAATLRHDGGGGAPVMASAGCFYSTVGSAVQPWHSDGPALATVPLRPYAVNVFIPTTAVTRENGTAFKPCTMGGAPPSGATDGAPPQVTVPQVDVGHALLFDYRVQHRGLSNRTSVARPCMYMTFTQPWYTDTYNFGTTRYRHTLDIAPAEGAGGRTSRASRREKAAATAAP